MFLYVKEARKEKTNYKYTCYFIQRSIYNIKEKPYKLRTTTMNTIFVSFAFYFYFRIKINCEKAKGVWIHIPFNLTIKNISNKTKGKICTGK